MEQVVVFESHSIPADMNPASSWYLLVQSYSIGYWSTAGYRQSSHNNKPKCWSQALIPKSAARFAWFGRSSVLWAEPVKRELGHWD